MHITNDAHPFLFTPPDRFGAYLSVLYIVTKVLYLVNALGQLFLLDWWLGTNYSLYGFHMVRWMVTDHDWTNSPFVAFPRVTMCDFNVRRVGNIHRYTIQCTLPINLYNEKIFTFLWFWIVAMVLLSLYSLVIWIARAASHTDKFNYIHGHLKWLKRLEGPEDRDLARDFTRKYLRADGIFLLRLIGHNTNTLTVSEIIGSMWDQWRAARLLKPRAPDPQPPAMPSAPAAEHPLMPSEKPPPSSGAYPTLPVPEKMPLPE